MDKELIHAKYGNDIDLYEYPYQGAIVYIEESEILLSFVMDPAWNKLVYGEYENKWVKIYGKFSVGGNGWYHPRSVATDGLGNIYVADTYNSRIVKLQYNSTNEEIDPNYFSTIGEGILQQPWDLDVDDKGNLDPSDDIIWVVYNGINQIVPINLSGTIVSNGPITHLYNSSTGTYYWDLSGLCGIAVRKSAAQGYNSTSNRRLYLVDWKLRKLFLVEAEALENGQGLIYKEKAFSSNVLLSGVESDYFGDVWVVDNANDKIYKYTWDLEYIDELTDLNNPTSVASVRRHHLNMAITERWTNTTGNRTYSQGADIKNVNINSSVYTANFDFRLTNYCYLVAKIYKGSTLKATFDDGTTVSPSGMTSFNWYPSNPTSGYYTLKLKAKSYDDSTNVYREINQNFYFGLEPPTNLHISGYPGGMPNIIWTASTSPDIDYYELWQREYDGNPPQGWQLLATTPATVTSWLDSRVTIAGYGEAEDTYCYKALAVNTDGLKSIFSNSDCVDVEESPPWKQLIELESIPEVYALKENYPNPFNPATTIRYALPEDSFVELRIYDLIGREIRILINGNESARYRDVLWDGKDSFGKVVPSGVYIYQFSARSVESNKEFHHTRKMVVLR